MISLDITKADINMPPISEKLICNSGDDVPDKTKPRAWLETLREASIIQEGSSMRNSELASTGKFRQLCKCCLKEWKHHSVEGRRLKRTAKALGVKQRKLYPDFLFFLSDGNKLCPKHVAYGNAASARRRTAKLQAMPKWVDTSKINAIYKECERISREKRSKHHVDHIVPLRGQNVCGLHVPWNLQILPAHENLRKGRKFPQS